MITLRPSGERGHANHGWLDSRHTFSFGDYYDPGHMGFRSLRVINEDRVAPGMGFPTHPHRDMEILTYVLAGRLAHRDSMGNGREIAAGELQAMSAGRGITHSEFNASQSEPAHFLQVWIVPERRGIEPHYAEWAPTAAAPPHPLILLASREARDGSARIAQDAEMYLLRLPAAAGSSYTLRPGRAAWVQVMRGALQLNSRTLRAGDGAAAEDESALDLRATSEAEALLFDLGGPT